MHVDIRELLFFLDLNNAYMKQYYGPGLQDNSHPQSAVMFASGMKKAP